LFSDAIPESVCSLASDGVARTGISILLRSVIAAPSVDLNLTGGAERLVPGAPENVLHKSRMQACVLLFML
jgi:hypothetical protein